MLDLNVLLYIVCLIEEYNKCYKMEGQEIIELFKKYNVFEYIIEFYDILHTQSIFYGVEDVHKLIFSLLQIMFYM